MGGRHDADFTFNQLCSLLIELGYTMRKANGSHVTFQLGCELLEFAVDSWRKSEGVSDPASIRQELPNLNLKP